MQNPPRGKTQSEIPDRSLDGRWGFSPISRRYVLRTGGVWRRLVKSAVVHDEEVAAQLARPAQGTVRKRTVNNVTIEADREAVSNTISEHFDASRLTGNQLRDIADHLARLNVSSSKPKTRRRPVAPTPASEDFTDGDEDQDPMTETTAAESESDAPDPREVARAVTERLNASSRPGTPIKVVKVVKPSRRPR